MIIQYLSDEVKPQTHFGLHTEGDLGHSAWLPVMLFEGSEDKCRHNILLLAVCCVSKHQYNTLLVLELFNEQHTNSFIIPLPRVIGLKLYWFTEKKNYR